MWLFDLGVLYLWFWLLQYTHTHTHIICHYFSIFKNIRNKMKKIIWTWWLLPPVIWELGRLRQEDH